LRYSQIGQIGRKCDKIEDRVPSTPKSGDMHPPHRTHIPVTLTHGE